MNRSKIALLVLLLACFLIRLLFALRIPATEFFYPDGYDYSRVAVGIAQGQGFYPPEMKPMNLYRAPLYPYLLAGVYKTAGIENLSAVRVLQCFLAVLTGLLIFGICRLWSLTAAGWIALAIFTLHPFFIYYCAGISPESLYLLLCLLSYFLLFKLFKTQQLRYAFPAGISLGLAALTKGTILLIAPAAALTLSLCMKKTRTKSLCAIGILAASSFLTISPLTCWIHRRWNEFGLMLDGAGINFWIANSDSGYRLLRAKTSEEFQGIQKHIYLEEIPAMNPAIEQLGPKARNAYYNRMGWHYVRQYPDRSLWMGFQRLKIFWKPWVHPLAYRPREVLLSAAATLPLFFFGFWGLFLRLKSREPDAIFTAAAFLILSVMVGFLYNTEIRYRIPLIDSLLTVYAGIALAHLLRWDAKTQRTSKSVL